MALDLGALAPVPNKLIANLPYGIAAGALLRTIEELGSLTRWVAMVQKEVGERLAAAPGSRTYGVPSVLCQLACEVHVLRPISRSVFFPVPNVDSVLIGMTRVAPAAAARAAALRAGSVRAPAQGARQIADAEHRAPTATGSGPPWSRWAARRTSAPSGSRRPRWRRCGRRFGEREAIVSAGRRARPR